MAMPFGHPLTGHCSFSGTAVAWFASSINFIKSVDEGDGMGVDASTSIASFPELIFAAKMGGGFLDFSEMKLYSDSPVGESRDHHVSDAIIACEASRAFSTCSGALGNYLELRDLCRLT
jgi:hypothetical protein